MRHGLELSTMMEERLLVRKERLADSCYQGLFRGSDSDRNGLFLSLSRPQAPLSKFQFQRLLAQKAQQFTELLLLRSECKYRDDFFLSLVAAKVPCSARRRQNEELIRRYTAPTRDKADRGFSLTGLIHHC